MGSRKKSNVRKNKWKKRKKWKKKKFWFRIRCENIFVATLLFHARLPKLTFERIQYQQISMFWYIVCICTHTTPNLTYTHREKRWTKHKKTKLAFGRQKKNININITYLSSKRHWRIHNTKDTILQQLFNFPRK